MPDGGVSRVVCKEQDVQEAFTSKDAAHSCCRKRAVNGMCKLYKPVRISFLMFDRILYASTERNGLKARLYDSAAREVFAVREKEAPQAVEAC